METNHQLRLAKEMLLDKLAATDARRRLAEKTLKDILSAIQNLEHTECAKVLGLLGYAPGSAREKLRMVALELSMPLAAERILAVINVSVASGF